MSRINSSSGGITQSQILSDKTPFSGANIANLDVKLSSLQSTLLDVIAATTQQLILPIKAAMDIATASNIKLTGNNYILQPSFSGVITGLSDLTTYTNTGTTLTVNSSTQVTAATLLGSGTDKLQKDHGAANIGDFNCIFNIDITADNNGSGAPVLFAISDTGANGVDVIGTHSLFIQYTPTGNLIDLAYDALGQQIGSSYAITLNVQYFCQLSRIGSTVTLVIRTDSQSGTVVATMTGTANSTLYRYVTVFYGGNNGTATLSGVVSNVDFPANNVFTGTITSTAIAKNVSIGLRYWGELVWNLVAGAAGSTIAVKICDSTGTPLHSNFVTIAPSEYARCPLYRPVVLTAGSDIQTVWNFTSLSNADAFINELGVLAEVILVELALDGTTYTALVKATNYTEDITNPKAPAITLVSGTGVLSGVSKLRAWYIINIPLSNTTIKVQIQLNRSAAGDTSPSITPLPGDAANYIQGGQVAQL